MPQESTPTATAYLGHCFTPKDDEERLVTQTEAPQDNAIIPCMTLPRISTAALPSSQNSPGTRADLLPQLNDDTW